MTAHLPALIVLVPLVVALSLPLFSQVSARLVRLLATLAPLAALASSVGALDHVLRWGDWHYYLGGWAPPWGIEYVIDPLAGGMAVLVSFLSLLLAFYSGPYLWDKPPLSQGVFYSLFLLLTTGLLGMVITGDVFNLYVFLEVSSLSAYALIASGGNRGAVAGFRYLLIGSVAASFYLLGVGYLYAATGTLNMTDLAVLLPPLLSSKVVLVAVGLIVVGLGTKMALFPLHGWLPDAYSYAPAPVAAFIAAVMSKVSAYALFRLLYFVVGAGDPVSLALEVVGWAAAAGILFGSIMTIAQRNFARMLAYSSVTQMSYIALGISLGNAMGLYGALLHILNHAVMKGCLFMVAGGVKWRTGYEDVRHFARMSRQLPIAMAAFVIAGLSMIGLPPTAGFFSKYYLILGSMQAGSWSFVAIIIASSLLTAIYFFRVIEYAYLRQHSPDKVVPPGVALPGEDSRPGLELPVPMLVPIVILGVAVVFLGVFSQQFISTIIQLALPGGTP